MMEDMPDYIARPYYIRQIRPFFDTHIIKVLIGQRRAGKSYILYQLMDEIKSANPDANIVYINMELSQFREIKNDADLYNFIVSKLDSKAQNYVFIDEIQDIQNFEIALRSLYAENRCDLCITGSNAHLMSGELATYLAGRYVQIRIHPLNYGEFLHFYERENDDESLRFYLKRGGMPYLSSLPEDNTNDERHAGEYLKNLYESILLRDVIARENIRNVRFLENLVSYLADNTGNLFSASNISRYLKNQRLNVPVQTVINYLAVLEKALLVCKVHRADIRGLKTFEIGEKYYFEDCGMRNVLASKPELDIAKQIEQAVYLHLVQQGYKTYVGQTGDREIDFAGERRGVRIYVQAAYKIADNTIYEREFGNLEQIGDHFPKYVVSLDEAMPPVNRNGIRWQNLREFLLTSV